MVHESPFAGSWYPGERAELERLLADLWERSEHRTGAALLPAPLAFVVPHAGLIYSGAVAASAYRHLADARPGRVVILGFSHNGSPPAVSIPDVCAIRTPLGEAAVDREAAESLAACRPFRITAERDVCDHSVEIQLPLLLHAAPGARIVPLYVGALDAVGRDAAARALAGLAGPGTVFLASSDFTHYGRSFGFRPFPPDDMAPARLRQLDQGAMEAASSLDPGLFFDYLRESGATVCGRDPVALLLRTLALMAPRDIFQQTLDYQTSGEITGDFHNSVSYAALGYFRASSFALSPEDQARLLESAHSTLTGLLRTGERAPVPPRGASPALNRLAGVFVSLHEDGELRGCIGHHEACRSLAAAVPELTLAAALDDPRFRPMREPSGEVEIEISVLTPHRRIASIDEFELGRHGVYLSSGMYRSLLLPQVADSGEWTRERFLECLARKAGLGRKGWMQPETRLYVFQAQVFSSVGDGRARSASAAA